MLFLPIPSNHRVWSRFNFQLRLAHFHGNIGTILDTQGNLEGALPALRKSLAVLENLVARNRKNTLWQWELALAHSKVATTLDRIGDLAGALEGHRVALTIRQALGVCAAKREELGAIGIR